MDKKIQIKNSFFDLIFFMVSFVFGFFRSVFLFFSFKNKKIRKNIFFDFLDFLFNIWPRYFWRKPTFYKITSFFGDSLNYIFRREK